jgi:hypothetical protein
MISHIVGKRNRFGGWDIQPKPMKSEDRKELLRKVAFGTELTQVRLIPPSENQLEGEAKIVAGDTNNQLQQEGKLRVVVDRSHDPVERRYKSRVVEFKVGETKQVPLGVACVILQTEPYCYLFEEVTEEGQSQKPRNIEDMLTRFEQLEALYQERLAKLQSIEAELKSKEDVTSEPTKTKK